MEIEAGLLDLYRDPSLDTKPKLLEERGGAFYSDAAAALIASLHTGTGDAQVVNLRNDGAIPNLPRESVVEITATIDRDGAHPSATAPLAPEMHGLVSHAKAYEMLTIEAAVGGSRTTALKALMTNPLVGDYRRAKPLLGRVAGCEPVAASSLLPELRVGRTRCGDAVAVMRSVALRHGVGPSRGLPRHPRCHGCRHGRPPP